jgi:hypothetical protein
MEQYEHSNWNCERLFRNRHDPAPEGRHSIARGVSPWITQRRLPSPGGAKGSDGMRRLTLSPLRGSVRGGIVSRGLRPWLLNAAPPGLGWLSGCFRNRLYNCSLTELFRDPKRPTFEDFRASKQPAHIFARCWRIASTANALLEMPLRQPLSGRPSPTPLVFAQKGLQSVTLRAPPL